VPVFKFSLSQPRAKCLGEKGNCPAGEVCGGICPNGGMYGGKCPTLTNTYFTIYQRRKCCFPLLQYTSANRNLNIVHAAEPNRDTNRTSVINRPRIEHKQTNQSPSPISSRRQYYKA